VGPSGNVSASNEGPPSKAGHYRSGRIYQRNPRAARNVADAISDAIAQIAKFPLGAERASEPALASRLSRNIRIKFTMLGPAE
jgi:plasmid stabilization system protein ParE